MRKTLSRRATAPLRALPDFLIIGAQRSGTTSLYNYLAAHPLVFPADKKEITFFNRGDRIGLGLNWYRSFFPLQSFKRVADGPAPQTGEATPEYLFFPHAARRIAQTLPHAKLIVLLRNPVNRAFSDHEMNVRKKREPLSFEEALAAETERTAHEMEKMQRDEFYFSNAIHLYTYRQRGLYANQLQEWLNYFPLSQMLILKSEEFFENPHHAFIQTLDFLGLPQHKLDEYEKFNSAKRDLMKPETRKQLSEFYRPHNQKLHELVGRDFGWE